MSNSYFKKNEDLAYCKPSILAIIGRGLATLVAGGTLSGGVPMDGPVRMAVRYGRKHSFPSGFLEVLPDGKFRETRALLSQQELVVYPTYPMSSAPIFRVVPHARIALLYCSKNGFKRARVRIETDTGEWRVLKIESRELEIMAKCLRLVRFYEETNC